MTGSPRAIAAALLTPGERADLFSPNKLRYWLDLGVTMTVSYAALTVAIVISPATPHFLVCFTIATLATYRGNFFLHELVHQRRRLGAFYWGYLLLYGFVHKIPVVAYLSHLEHHEVSRYADPNDPEYAEWWAKPTLAVRDVLVAALAGPLWLAVRYGFMSGLMPWLSRRAREHVYARWSSFALNPRYVRRPELWPRRMTLLEECGCFGYTVAAIALCVSGYIPWTAFVVWYAMMSAFFLLHFARALVNHGYGRFHRTESLEAMLADCRNVTGHPVLSELWAPLAVRYHTLHHLFPRLPYHSLARVHARLLPSLALHDVYRSTTSAAFVDALRKALRSRRGRTGAELTGAVSRQERTERVRS